jgi:ABC-type bacteriocin/lantibiotic exporter with double-glycine peptidase domain
MVLASLDIERSELELRALCDCTPFGTEALSAVDAARQLGLLGTGKYTLSSDELETQVRQGLYPIVLVNTLPIDGTTGGHALVVVAIDPARVSIYDPLHGEGDLSRATFESAWAMMHGLTILVQR